MAHDLVTELLQYSSLACFMPIWQLCANLLIPNCLRSNLSYSPLAALELYVKITQTVLSIAWIQMFLTPIILIVWYLFSDEFSYSSWTKNTEIIVVFAFTGVTLFLFIGFFILDPIKDRIIKRIKENNIHNS